MMITMNRGSITPGVFRKNIENMTSGAQYEVLIADQGSDDPKILKFLTEDVLTITKGTIIRRMNKTNEGVGRSFNQLFLRSSGRVIVLLGNDIIMPTGWDQIMLDYTLKVVNSGLVGINWGHSGTPPLSTSRDGIIAHWLTPTLDKVFGPTAFRREIPETIGLFHEGFHPYGLEDSDFNNRVNIAGFRSCYVPNMKCEHVGHDVGEKSAYRAMKDESLKRNIRLLGERMESYSKNGIQEPLPPIRQALV